MMVGVEKQEWIVVVVLARIEKGATQETNHKDRGKYANVALESVVAIVPSCGNYLL